MRRPSCGLPKGVEAGIEFSVSGKTVRVAPGDHAIFAAARVESARTHGKRQISRQDRPCVRRFLKGKKHVSNRFSLHRCTIRIGDSPGVGAKLSGQAVAIHRWLRTRRRARRDDAPLRRPTARRALRRIVRCYARTLRSSAPPQLPKPCVEHRLPMSPTSKLRYGHFY